jgi:hypothetical protein
MDELSWWRVMWRVDEIGVMVCSALKGAWCKDLERNVRISRSKSPFVH